MQILRKLTIKSCGDFTIAKIKGLLKEAAEGSVVDLLKIAGESVGASTGETDKGSFTKLMGSFVGTDLTTGEMYQSGVCILPEFVGAQLGAAVLQSQGAVQFAFKIGAKRVDSAITGYAYVISPIGEVAQTDTQKRLLVLMGETPKLAAPDQAPAMSQAQAQEPAQEPAQDQKKARK